MFRKYHLIVLENNEKVDLFTKIAANHRLQCLYKIGVYGNEQQHELYIIGSYRNYRKFLKIMFPKTENK